MSDEIKEITKFEGVELSKISPQIFVLTMKAGENRFNPTFLKQLNDCLDIVEK
jgi:hypothetical protein